uniref:Uncharacterized protein n=1 Tax=Ciona savignyi TaxID=51511 RepID=H2YT79_CIOSA
MPSWWIGLIFPVAIPDFRVWQGTHFKSSNDLKIHYFRQTRWNGHQYPGMVMDQRYMAEFEREPGVDYSENPGPRPLIVFRHKVYEPSSTEIVEHRMQVYQLSNYRRNLPPNFETFPVLSVTTPAPSTVSTTAPRTAGPNAGIFWW